MLLQISSLNFGLIEDYFPLIISNILVLLFFLFFQKSKQATEATFLIIETFAKLRALQKTVAAVSSTTGNKKNTLLKKSGELMADLLDQDMTETESETTLELNFAVLKLKHTTKRKK